jgi:hypothetical protein
MRTTKHSIRSWLRREYLTPLDLMYERLDDNLQDGFVSAGDDNRRAARMSSNTAAVHKTTSRKRKSSYEL